MQAAQPAAWWTFDDPASLGRDSAGTNDAALVGAPLAGSGVRNNGILMNGAGDFLRVPDSPSLEITGPLTVLVWANANAVNKNYAFVYKATSWNDGQMAYMLDLDWSSGGYYPRFAVSSDGYASGYATVVSTEALTPGQWHLIAGVYDGTNLMVYVDGKLEATRAYSAGIYPGTDPLYIGWNWNCTWKGALAEVRNLLVGQPGSNVTVSVVRARRAEPEKVVMTRSIVTIPPVTEKIVADGIGIVQVDAFTKGKSQEVANKVKALEKDGAKRLILDLRNCAQGEELEGIATANLFLNHGTITYLQGQKYPREAFSADASKVVSSLPLVVLVNKGTAGPAEIVAAAVLENARGDVVGDKTFGDGSVQKVMELPDGSALILSVAKYYTPSGKAIQDTAVTPNVLVADVDDDGPLPDEDENAVPADQVKKPQPPQQDEQLQKAIEVLKSRTS